MHCAALEFRPYILTKQLNAAPKKHNSRFSSALQTHKAIRHSGYSQVINNPCVIPDCLMIGENKSAHDKAQGKNEKIFAKNVDIQHIGMRYVKTTTAWVGIKNARRRRG